MSKQIIIIGGGSSIKEEIDKGLWNRLKGKWTIGLNYSYNFFNSTMLCYADSNFYNEESKKEKFQNLPLIIGKEHSQLKILPNTMTLKTNDVKYFRDVKLGCYKSNLCGIFALSLAIYLLDEGEIYLLGYDYGATKRTKDGRALTHFYQGKINHRGIGNVNYFDTIGRADKDFGVYQNESKVHIYNVSLESKITIFPKLSYAGFFDKLDNQQYNQKVLKQFIEKNYNNKGGENEKTNNWSNFIKFNFD